MTHAGEESFNRSHMEYGRELTCLWDNIIGLLLDLSLIDYKDDPW
jgi:hypothetical protein